MVSEVRLSKPSSLNSDGEHSQQEEAINTSSSSDEESETSYENNKVVLRNDDSNPELPTFGNVSVMNCNDIHFGNKTVYQGPVTIKQFLYGSDSIANGDAQKSIGCDNEVAINNVGVINKGYENPVFVPETLDGKQKNGDAKIVPAESGLGFRKAFRRLQKFSRQNIIILVSLLAILIVSLTILATVLTLRHGAPPKDHGTQDSYSKGDTDEQENNTPIEAPLDPATNLTMAGKLKLVSRLQWLAQPPVQPANNLTLPLPYVIIHHTATEGCDSQAQCIFQVRHIQTFHIESNNWWDIGYNFLVGGDGEAYEGRGWESEGAHSYGYNYRSIGIAFIGTFNTELPPERQITACKLLIQKGIEKGYLKKDYKILAARQLQTTQDPGAALYENMKTWDHWAKKP